MGKYSTTSSVILSFDRGTLLMTGVNHKQVHTLFDTQQWTWDGRLGAWRCTGIHYVSVRRVLGECFGDRLDDQVPRPESVRWKQINLPALREDQREALTAWQAADGRGQIIMPTGTGKTEIALAAMAESAVATLVVAPVRDLMYQWHHRILLGLGYDAGKDVAWTVFMCGVVLGCFCL